MNLLNLAKFIGNIINEKKADNVVIWDVNGVSNFTDYFIICNGNSTTQVHAISNAIETELKDQNIQIKGIEGYTQGRWILIDLGDIIVNIFHKDERDFYGLDRIWGDCKQIKF